jgi:hypothetical protein
MSAALTRPLRCVKDDPVGHLGDHGSSLERGQLPGPPGADKVTVEEACQLVVSGACLLEGHFGALDALLVGRSAGVEVVESNPLDQRGVGYVLRQGETGRLELGRRLFQMLVARDGLGERTPSSAKAPSSSDST